jgi:hypothetical protein
MSFCANCGGKLGAGARFCNGCGKPVQAPSCYQCEKPIAGKVLNVGTAPPLFCFYFLAELTPSGRAADGEPTCEKCNAEMDAAIGQALTNAQSEHSKYGGFIDRKYSPLLLCTCSVVHAFKMYVVW